MHHLRQRDQFHKNPLVILSMEKTMVAKVISEVKSVTRFKNFPETGPRTAYEVSEQLCWVKGGQRKFRQTYNMMECSWHQEHN